MTKTKSQKQRSKAARRKVVTKARQIVRTTIVKRRKIRKPMRRLRMPSGLSPCARDYLRVRQNPFSGETACIPTSFNVPSQKSSVRARGIISTGTNGCGGIIVSPMAFMGNNNYSLVTSAVMAGAIGTDNTYTGTGLPSSTSTGAIGIASNSQWSATTSQSSLRGRTVAIGLKVRNVTPLMNRGGFCIGVETPGHSFLTGLQPNDILGFDQAETCDSNGSWNSVVFNPIEADELDYYALTQLPSNSTYAVNDPSTKTQLNYCLGFFISAPATSNPQQYEYEITGCYESVGFSQHGETASPSDTVGLDKVQSMFSDVSSRKPVVGDRTYADVLSGHVPGMVGAAVGLGTSGLYATYRGGLPSFSRTQPYARFPDSIL